MDTILSAGKLRSVGYPGEAIPNFAFNGEAMWTSLGDYWTEGDAGFGSTTERNFGHYNDMTGGCSGGPIFTDAATPAAIGLNSHVRLQNNIPEQPPRMFSPYFSGALVMRLVNWLKANGGQPNDPVGSIIPDPNPNIAAIKAELQAAVHQLNTAIARL